MKINVSGEKFKQVNSEMMMIMINSFYFIFQGLFLFEGELKNYKLFLVGGDFGIDYEIK